MFQTELHRCNEWGQLLRPETGSVETMLRSVLFTTISPSAEQRTVDLMVPSSTYTTGAGNMGMSPSNFLLIQFPVCVPLSAHYSATLPHRATLGHQQPSRETKPSPFIALSLGKPYKKHFYFRLNQPIVFALTVEFVRVVASGVQCQVSHIDMFVRKKVQWAVETMTQPRDNLLKTIPM